MTATAALLLDAYREMNAKRLFTVVLVVSVVIVVVFAGVSITPDGVSIFGFKSVMDFGNNLSTPANFYKLLYVNFGVRLWLEWAAMILAVISTAGIFPDFLASGSVDLYLCRPISRLRLFFFKYFSALFFVILQVSLFSVACFLVIGFRGGDWEPGLLLAVPLVTLLFSYLYCVCALAGVLTRSTMAALLITMTAWFIMGGAQSAEEMIRGAQVFNQIQAERLDSQIAVMQQQLATAPSTQAAAAAVPAEPAESNAPPAKAPTGIVGGLMRDFFAVMPNTTHGDRASIQRQLQTLRTQRAAINVDIEQAHRIVYWLDAPLPKTSDTISLIEREVLPAAHMPQTLELPTADPRGFLQRRYDRNIAETTVNLEIRKRSASWIVGTSLGFEAVVVCLAAWVFCRRDY